MRKALDGLGVFGAAWRLSSISRLAKLPEHNMIVANQSELLDPTPTLELRFALTRLGESGVNFDAKNGHHRIELRCPACLA
jgi:hypothetical protein